MTNVTTATARVIAMGAGATLTIQPGVAHDPTDSALSILAETLHDCAFGTGIQFLALWHEGSTLTAQVDDEGADEPLCPLAFDRMVRRLSYERLGEVWSGVLEVQSNVTVAAPAVLVRVA